MHQQIRNSAQNATKSSKPLIFMVSIAACALFALLFTTWLHHSKTRYTHKQLSLPEQSALLDEQELAKKNNDWTIITTHAGDSLASIFKHLGLSQQTLLLILQKNPYAKNLSGIKPNQQLQFLIKNQVLEQLVIPFNDTQVLVVSHKDGQYVSHINLRKMNSHNQYVTATVRGSLYSTAQRMNIPSKLIHQMTEIFNWNIDFARDIRPGDQFSILYNAFYVDDKWVSSGDILAVSYTNKGVVHQAIRHVNAAGDYDYYTPEGISLKKAFSRYPIKFSHISSTFSLSRQHPVLHYKRAHKGVDLAAPIGTPIHATGDGRIEIMSRQNDYGNMVKISHNKTYASVYGHLLKFQKGLSKGDVVKRGQVIGYVGQSGLATGPHCHYELHINKVPKNPTTTDLPRAAPVSARERASFKANAEILLARLKLFEEANLVGAAGKKSVNTG
ncbi:MAG TPA: peptidase M24 [Legionella sp.]|nr:peptidase M24 [Legionella sp.]